MSVERRGRSRGEDEEKDRKLRKQCAHGDAPCLGQAVPGYCLLLPHGFQHLCCLELKVKSKAPGSFLSPDT